MLPEYAALSMYPKLYLPAIDSRVRYRSAGQVEGGGLLTFAVLQIGCEDWGVKGRLRIVEESLLLVGGHSVQTAEGQSYEAIVVAVGGE